ncbi:hypothetical protein [Ensifer canadensis]
MFFDHFSEDQRDGAREAVISGNVLVLALWMVSLHQLVAGMRIAITETSVGTDPLPTLGPAQPFHIHSQRRIATAIKPEAKLRPAARSTIVDTPVAAGIRAILNEPSLERKAIVAALLEAAVFHLG